MKALLNEDVIVHITEFGDTEIGDIPKRVGLERLRFDGQKVVDLNDLIQIWVRDEGNDRFSLHAVQVPGSQLVAMTYQERKVLINDAGIIRVMTALEIADRIENFNIEMIENRLMRRLKSKVGPIERQIRNTEKLMFALIVYARQQPSVLADFFDSIIPDIKDTYPLNRIEQELRDACKEIKQAVDEYYAAIDTL